MKTKKVLLSLLSIISFLLIIMIQTAYGQESNITNSSTPGTNNTLTNLTIPAQTNQTSNTTLTTNSTNTTQNSSQTQTNTTSAPTETPNGNPDNGSGEDRPAAKPPVISPVWGFDMVKIIPGDVKIGDSQINILIRNTGNQNLTNINAVITGDGVSVYNEEPIANLAASDSKYILVWINTKKSGKIPLSVRIQDKTFTANLNVVDSEQTIQAKKDAEEQTAKRHKIRELQADLTNLSDIYEAFQKDYYIKESKGYEMSSININDAKSYLRDAQSALAKEDLGEASANEVLLRTELSDLREKLVSAAPKPRTWKDMLKENIPLLSGILGILVGGIAVYEKLKHKAEKVKENGLFNKGEKKGEE